MTPKVGANFVNESVSSFHPLNFQSDNQLKILTTS